MSRVLMHVSDLHFGRIQPGLPQALLEEARRISPDVVVVSGDLTQRARRVEFTEARAFLDQLPFPVIVVPGNHDVPLHNLYGRFIERLARFQHYITPDLEPVYRDPEVAVFGVNSARSLTWKGGRLNALQIETLRARLCAIPPEVARVVVTHHPFDLPDGLHRRNLVGSARAAVREWTSCGADLLLSGHLHLGDATTTLVRYGAAPWQAIVVTAGTAISSRGRGAANSFNVISITGRERVTVSKLAWDAGTDRFGTISESRFEKTPGGWIGSEARA